VRRYEANNSADTIVSEKTEEGGAPGAGGEIFPLQPVMKTMVRQAVPLQFMKVHGGADLHLQPWETPHQSRGMPKAGLVTPWGIHTGAGCF